jgi:CRISPR/Cas system CMR-associated protein Cmr3 (group 5 of RAMP superfamily)
MYPGGYFPIETAMFDSLKIYRNTAGIFFHRSSNIGVSSSFFSDNGLDIDIENTLSPPIRLNNVTFVGESDTFRNVVMNPKLDKGCLNNIGIELRTWKGAIGGTGSLWQNLRFRNYNHRSCQYVTPISMEYAVSAKRSLPLHFSIRFLTNLLLFCFENLILIF